MLEGDEFHPARCEQFAQMRDVVPLLGVKAHGVNARTRALRDELPGHEVRVVLHYREHDLVTGLEVRGTPSARDEVDCLGGVARVHDFGPVAGVMRPASRSRVRSKPSVARAARVCAPRCTFELSQR